MDPEDPTLSSAFCEFFIFPKFLRRDKIYLLLSVDSHPFIHTHLKVHLLIAGHDIRFPYSPKAACSGEQPSKQSWLGYEYTQYSHTTGLFRVPWIQARATQVPQDTVDLDSSRHGSLLEPGIHIKSSLRKGHSLFLLAFFWLSIGICSQYL